MGQDELPAAEMAALQGAILGTYEAEVQAEAEAEVLSLRRQRPWFDRMVALNKRLEGSRWRRVLLAPWVFFVDMRAIIEDRPWLATRQESRQEIEASEQRTVSLYCQLSGKEPQDAQVDVWEIQGQLRALDKRRRPDDLGYGMAGVADRAELEAAAGVLLAYYLGGRQADDALLREI